MFYLIFKLDLRWIVKLNNFMNTLGITSYMIASRAHSQHKSLTTTQQLEQMAVAKFRGSAMGDWRREGIWDGVGCEEK